MIVTRPAERICTIEQAAAFVAANELVALFWTLFTLVLTARRS